MIKKFYEFRSGSDIDIEEPLTKPVIKPVTKPTPPPFPNPYEEEEDEDDDLEITPDFKPQPKLEEEIIINKLKDVLKEKGMNLEDLYKMCINL